MKAAFVKKAYEAIKLSDNDTLSVAPDIFAFRAFQHLTYNREISSFLVASQLLRLPNHYTLSDNFKSINLSLL